jgi:hypothetical protein
MTTSRIFHPTQHKRVEKAIIALLNSQPDFLSAHTVSSTRAIGDAIQTILSEKFQSLLGSSIAEYSSTFARRAMADLAFTDRDGFYYIVDVKTHHLETHFNMPNLTSVERLARFYEDDKNYFAVLTIKYVIQGTRVIVKKAHLVPIEFLAWDCLTIGALGWGQIQIANANTIKINEGYSRKNGCLNYATLCSSSTRKRSEKSTNEWIISNASSVIGRPRAKVE